MINILGIDENVSDMNQQLLTRLMKNTSLTEIEGYLYYGYPILDLRGQSGTIKGLLICDKGVFFFHNEDSEEKQYKRFISSLISKSEKLFSLSEENVFVFPIKLSLATETIVQEILAHNNMLSLELIKEFNSIVQGVFSLVKEDIRKVLNPNSVGALIRQRSKEVANLDENQFRMLYQENDTHLRVRGLPGSGKTILLAKKLAYMHFKNRELNLAYVFYTKSLKEYIEELFFRFYSEFDQYQKPDMSKVHILHCWGGKSLEGFYSLICTQCGIAVEQYDKSKFSTVEQVSKSALNAIGNREIGLFDYVFIDEAQDFRLDFFKLAVKSLKAIVGKLIYAYDELQTLDSSESMMPSPKEIFGKAEKCIDISLPCCYRCPREILVAAHALGLGIYHKGDDGKSAFINFIGDKSVWTAVGYKVVEGSLEYGKDVVLCRDSVISNDDNDAICINNLNLENSINTVVNTIFDLIQNEDVFPEDILIIDLDTKNTKDNFNHFRKRLWNELCLRYPNEESRRVDTNIVDSWGTVFRIQDSIPYTTVYRAKGNEANIVFILNSHKMSMLGIYSRNKLFTAMTRARFKVYIYGEGSMIESAVTELNEVKHNNYRLAFKYPTKVELDNFKNQAYKERKDKSNIDEILRLSREVKKNSPELLMQTLLEQTGMATFKDLRDYLGTLDKGKTDE